MHLVGGYQDIVHIKLTKRSSFTTQQFGLQTNYYGVGMKLSCRITTLLGWHTGETHFPTYNGVDPLNEIDCVKGKWSLPDDMGPVRCEAVKCPPFPNIFKEIETKCTRRDRACIEAKNYENVEDCECHIAESTCKPELITSYNKTHEVEPQRTRSQSHHELFEFHGSFERRLYYFIIKIIYFASTEFSIKIEFF